MKEANVFVSAYKEGFKGITAFKERGSKFVRNNGYILINKHTGLRLYWEDWKKWKAFEDTPEEIRNYEYTKDEIREHDMAAAKHDRLSLNSPTQGTGAEIIKLSLILLGRWILKNGYFGIVKICDVVHDID